MLSIWFLRKSDLIKESAIESISIYKLDVELDVKNKSPYKIRVKIAFGRENRIWTCNLMVPNHAHYQVVLFPDIGAPNRSWTHNLLIRSQTLYPIELWAHNNYITGVNFTMVAPIGIEPTTQGFSVLCSTDWATEP